MKNFNKLYESLMTEVKLGSSGQTLKFFDVIKKSLGAKKYATSINGKENHVTFTGAKDGDITLVFSDSVLVGTIINDVSYEVPSNLKSVKKLKTLFDFNKLKEVQSFKATKNESIKIKVTSYELGKMIEDERDVSNLDVSEITDMSEMFAYTTFNGNINNWDDVSKVRNMQGMFKYSNFNKDISNWDVSLVRDMSYMFYGCSFVGDVTKWDVDDNVNTEKMFSDFPLSNRKPDWFTE